MERPRKRPFDDRPRRRKPKTPEDIAREWMTPEKLERHAEILSNRVRNRYAHLAKRFKKQEIDCFRLYDWDIPEVRAVVDWYAGHIVVGEYVRWQTGTEWLPRMAQAVGKALDLPAKNVHVRRRQTDTKDKPRYTKLNSTGARLKVRERYLQFWVNLEDYLDTGLFSDHRNTRDIVGKMAAGKDFLNLYGYTGTFTCAAAAARANSTVTIDRSKTYLDWAYDNLKLNGFVGPQHQFIQSDVSKFLAQTKRQGRKFTLALIDPPSFFQDKLSERAFDINQDHPELIRSVLEVMAPRSVVFFSTNHQRFDPHLEGLRVRDLKELTPGTIPEDYRNRKAHRCWQMTVL